MALPSRPKPRRAARPAGDRAASTAEAPGLPALVLLDDQADRLGPIQALTVERVADSADLARALGPLRRGVVAVVSPPATTQDIEAVARIRTRRQGIRALLVNAADDAHGRLAALILGFDDAIPVTVAGEELAGRIALLAERTRDELQDRLPVGIGVELDLTARALRRDGRLVHLRPMEFRLLEELARNPGRPIPRPTLLRRVWGAEDRDGSRTVDVHMRWLRSKVEPDPERPVHLLTVRGVGYQLELGRVETPDPLTRR